MASEKDELDKIDKTVNNGKQEILGGENFQLPGINACLNSDHDVDQRSNNATSLDVPGLPENFPDGKQPEKKDSVTEANEINAVDYLHAASLTRVSAEFDSDSEDGFCVLRHSRSDDIHASKSQEVDKVNQETAAGSVSEEFVDHRNVEDSSYTDSPGVFSQEEAQSVNDDDDTDSAVDDRVSNIEEEYIQRIYGLEQRHYELEDVLARLVACLDGTFNNRNREQQTTGIDQKEEEAEEESKDVDETADVDVDIETEQTDKAFREKVGLELFIEFQTKLRNFASDLNGVLNCSEAAIRHARVVQQWATSVQIMFEQIKEERQKILNYIDERERSILVVKEQFIAEFQEQGRQLQQLVDEMNSYAELRDKADDLCRKKLEEEGIGKNLAGDIIDMVLSKRMDHEQSIMLSLNKQSKISELKLFIIHQQNCIQQLQEQNKELKAIIEGLMGPEDMEEEEELCDTDQSGTPASVDTPEHCPVREVLSKLDDSPLCLVSDVLHCDRGEYKAGTSTDGDIATIKTYNIGKDTDKIEGGENVVFDPLSVAYVRQQCQLAEETERQIHEAENIVTEDLTSTDIGVKVLQDGVEAINIEPYLRKLAVMRHGDAVNSLVPERDTNFIVEEEDRLVNAAEEQDAAGDGIDKTLRKSLNKNNDAITKSEVTEKSCANIPIIVVTPPSPEDQEIDNAA